MTDNNKPKMFFDRDPSKRVFLIYGKKGGTFFGEDAQERTIEEYLANFLINEGFDSVSFYNENHRLYCLDEKSARNVIMQGTSVVDVAEDEELAYDDGMGTFMTSYSDDEEDDEEAQTEDNPEAVDYGDLSFSEAKEISGLFDKIDAMIKNSTKKRHALIFDGPNMLANPAIINNFEIWDKLCNRKINPMGSIVIFLTNEGFVNLNLDTIRSAYHGYFMLTEEKINPACCIMYSYEQRDEICSYLFSRYVKNKIAFENPDTYKSEIDKLTDEIIYCRSRRISDDKIELQYTYLFKFLDSQINILAQKKGSPVCLTCKDIDDIFEIEGGRKDYNELKQKTGWEKVIKTIDPIVDAGKKEYEKVIKQKSQDSKYEMTKTRSYVSRLSGAYIPDTNGLAIPHFALTGKPGTGKTTIARLLGAALKESHYLENGHVHEVAAADLIGQYVGQTYSIVNKALDAAEGGILFIDEAPQLAVDKHNEHSSFNSDAINTLIHALTDPSRHFSLVLAGYPEEMEKLFDSDKGFRRRVTYKIEIDDFDSQTLKNIFLSHLAENNVDIPDDEDFDAEINKLFTNIKKVADQATFGNAGGAQNIALAVESKVKAEKRRVMQLDDLGDDYLFYTDYYVRKRLEGNQFEEWLDNEYKKKNLTGLDDVKNLLLKIKAALIKDPDMRFKNYNFMIVGPAGCGKTTVAKILGDAFYQLGIRKKNKVVITKKDEIFTSSYVNDAKDNITKKINEAIGGTLFVDEAYQFVQDGEFHSSNAENGRTVIETIMSACSEEGHQASTSFILAGYSEEMQKVLKSNKGMERRFPEDNRISIKPYPVDVLISMFENKTKDKFNLTAQANRYLRYIINVAKSNENNSNAGYIQNIVERLERQYADKNQTVELDANDIMNVMFPKRAKTAEEFAERLDEAFKGLFALDGCKDLLGKMYERYNKTIEFYSKGYLSKVGDESYNMILLGKPGSGKTVMCNAISSALCAAGIRNDRVVMRNANQFLSGAMYGSQMSRMFDEAIKEAEGGVLFIDEAHNLGNSSEFVISLLKYSETHRASTTIILAGYDDDMITNPHQQGIIKGLISKDEGLSRRFPPDLRIRISYSTDDLLAVARNYFDEQIKVGDYKLEYEENFNEKFKEYITKNHIETPGPLIRDYCAEAALDCLESYSRENCQGSPILKISNFKSNPDKKETTIE